MDQDIRLYIPDREKKLGIAIIWKEIVQEIWSSRELIWRLFIRDFSAKYKQSILGFLWVFIVPIFTVGIFVLLKQAGILRLEFLEVPYPLYALAGITIWQIFASGLLLATQSLIGAGELITKINFPMIAIVASSFCETFVEFIIRCFLVIALFIWFQYLPSFYICFLPFMLIPLFLFTIGIGLVFSVLNVLLRDVGKVIGYLVMLLMLVTPVLYPAPTSGKLAFLYRLNPFTHLVNGPRDITFSGSLTDPFAYFLTAIFSLFLFLFALLFFHIVARKVPERI